jgi:P27 family predicted phage terminase small subunit
MGRRGPKPTPTELKLLRGETRPSRVNLDEPQPLPAFPEVPDHLSDDAKAVWAHVREQMGHTRVIRGADRDILELYCETLARYREASALLERSGFVIKGARHGDLVRNPLVAMVRDLTVQVRAVAGELGLTPASRTSLRAGATSGDLPLIVDLEQDRARQAGDRGLVGEDAHHVGAALDLLVDPFD